MYRFELRMCFKVKIYERTKISSGVFSTMVHVSTKVLIDTGVCVLMRDEVNLFEGRIMNAFR